MWLTTILTLLIFVECVAVVYVPSFAENKLSKLKKNKFLSITNLENVASGAILALAFIHMLPEVIILLNKKNINLYYTFTLILVSITFLNITDILYDHHAENSFDFDDTQDYEDKNNTIKKVNEKTNDTNCVSMDINETKDLELRSLDVKDKNNSCKSLLMGSLKDKNAVVIVGLSMLAHKWAECLIVYKNVVNKTENTFLSSIYAWSFILSLPLGVFIAIFSFPSNEFVEIIFSSIACGFFLYLSFNMTKDIKITKSNKYYISFSYFLGVCSMSTLMIIFNFFENSNVV
ncbi:ZIP domain-containing protein, putative [Plasmodium malariae]|uniref:ZIP domain-containing protein, putative n=1 Tax=Plasmodium malariae TaxID=5858 RepID=A0A1C3KDZ9_PLAMA|nr:ZIP domain-containing protein, putative [Plasmodium malariae]SBT71767.1 ZIP domain-containing protein, putative [Plasmodium malariae]SCN44969.1 ZIP domain-containing protein, putative [Plasmodium malariae]